MKNYGYTDLANIITNETLDLVSAQNIPHEYFNPENGDPLGAPAFGWTSSLFIDLIENFQPLNKTQI